MGRNKKVELKKAEVMLKGKKGITHNCECICEIVDTFLCCDIEKCEIISYCDENRLIVKGNVHVKIHYISDGACKPVRTKKCEIPFHEIMCLDGKSCSVGYVDCCVLYQDIELYNPYSINYAILLGFIWDECVWKY